VGVLVDVVVPVAVVVAVAPTTVLVQEALSRMAPVLLTCWRVSWVPFTVTLL